MHNRSIDKRLSEREREREGESYKVECLGELIGSCFIVVED